MTYSFSPEPWERFAACRDGRANVDFFSLDKKDVKLAIAVCETCPARLACLEFALNHRIDDGVFGGLAERERRNLRRTRVRHARIARTAADQSTGVSV